MKVRDLIALLKTKNPDSDVIFKLSTSKGGWKGRNLLTEDNVVDDRYLEEPGSFRLGEKVVLIDLGAEVKTAILEGLK